MPSNQARNVKMFRWKELDKDILYQEVTYLSTEVKSEFYSN